MAKRRANGEGTLRQRKDGRWEASFMTGWHDDGRRKIKSFYGKTAREVQQKVQKWKRDISDGIVADKDYLFSEWADMWFDMHKHNITETTQEHYKYTLRGLKERLLCKVLI